ncbi:MAG TPA: L-threonylcarbamoyladenylate synthase [Nitrospirota bacterium]
MRTVSIAGIGLERALKEAAAIICAGGVAAYPTESFYALGADATNPAAVEKIFALKGREAGKPLPVIVHDIPAIWKLAPCVPPKAARAAGLLLPGPVTLIFEAATEIPDNLTAGTGTIAVRVPDHEAAAGLARAAGVPVTATSANLSGLPGITEPAEISRIFGDKIDLLVDGGATPGEPVSTLLDMTAVPPKILRRGALPRERIESLLGGLYDAAPGKVNY